MNSNHSKNTVSFNETMILDAGSSYDPDSPKASLNINWTYNGGSLKLLNRTRIELSPFERLDSTLQVGTSTTEKF